MFLFQGKFVYKIIFMGFMYYFCPLLPLSFKILAHTTFCALRSFHI